MISSTSILIRPFVALLVLCGQEPLFVLAGDSRTTAFQNDNDLQHKTIRGSPKNGAKKVLGKVNAVYDLIDRVLKDPKAKDSICLSIVDSQEEKPWFRLEQREHGCKSHKPSNTNNKLLDDTTSTSTTTTSSSSSISSSSGSLDDVAIAITATSASELTAGLGHYFKHYCNFTIEWSTGGRAGGSHIVVPKTWPVPLEEEKTVLKYRTTQWSYLMNVCTHSYSLVWYDWASWQSLIDNMALRGINMVLALTGQEEIQYKIFSKLGLKDHDIRSWFNGPAFLTWSRGQNEYGSGIAGPLPRSFMKNQWALQKEHILPRLRSLGMVGILPAFQGNVPIQLKDLYKDANITQQEDTGWMDALDPLYAKVADMWMTELIEDFGTDHYYQLDGWFNGGVPPWMRNEKNQQQTNHTKQHQQQETTAATQRRSLAAVADKTTTTQEEPMVSKLLTHDEGWYKRGQAAYSGLNRTDPDAVWMYQGFAFVDWSTPKQASYVKGFVDSVPLGNFIVIDMTYSQDGEWQKWGNASFFGAPFIWSKLHNFGDTSGMRGDMDHINRAFPYQALEAKSSIVGIGGTPEGIDQNPLYYDFLYEQNFRSEPVKNLTSYLIKLNHKRYGLHETDPHVVLAWTYLLKSSYSQDFSVQDMTAVAHLDPRQSNSLFENDRYTPKPLFCDMYNAYFLLLKAASNMLHGMTDPFLYDLTNAGREVFAQLTIPMALNFSDARSKESMNHEELSDTGRSYIELLLNLDSILGYNVAFLLDPWLESARRLSQEDTMGDEHNDCVSPILVNQSDEGCCSCFYEFNARSQLTTWNPTPYNANRVPGGPVDYAAKHWSGLIKSYYAKRASIMLKQALNDQQSGQPLNSTEVDRLFAVHAYEWTTSVNSTSDNFATSSSLLRDRQNVSQENIRTSKEMLGKYFHWFQACH